MKPRQSSIEPLRVLAMGMIIAGHFVGQSGLLAVHDGIGWMLFGSGARWACNLFLIVGCWFMVNAVGSPLSDVWKRVWKLWLMVFIYSTPLTILAVLCGAEASIKDVCRGFLPFLGRPLWFASAYISLLLVSPWLGRAFELPQRQLGLLVLSLTIIIPGICTLPDPQMCYTIDVCYFFYMYLLVGFLKRMLRTATLPTLNTNTEKWLSLLLGLAIYVGMVMLSQSKLPFLPGWCRQCLSDFKTIPNLVSALLVFNFFRLLDIGSIGLINSLASASFAAYVIHQTPAFYDFLWLKVFRTHEWAVSPYAGAYAICVVTAVYLVCWCAETVRRRAID